MARAHHRLVEFLTQSGPSKLVESFNSGCNLESRGFAIAEFTAQNLPTIRPLLAWYSLVDGQSMLNNDEEEMEEEPPSLFGSFECYGQGITFLVVGYCRTSRYVLCFVAKVPAGLVHLVGHFVTMEPSGQRFIDFGLFGEFMERFVDEVVAGERKVDPETDAISMFKRSGRGTSVAVTQGIEVRVSSICCLYLGNPAGQWSYEVSLKYLEGECPYPSAQLESRKWQISYRSGKVERVEGLAVVGHHPKLSPDLFDPFPEGDPPVSMSGSFIFVPGTIQNPCGEKFEVQVARWEFEYPQRILAGVGSTSRLDSA
ncbi:F-box protein skip16 [Gonapodya sp. JEL0774]|nr:F-box protein skip16 [Gonapodya sp. JEL0774]